MTFGCIAPKLRSPDHRKMASDIFSIETNCSSILLPDTYGILSGKSCCVLLIKNKRQITEPSFKNSNSKTSPWGTPGNIFCNKLHTFSILSLCSQCLR